MNISYTVFQWYIVHLYFWTPPSDFLSTKMKTFKWKIENPTRLSHSSHTKLYEHNFYCETDPCLWCTIHFSVQTLLLHCVSKEEYSPLCQNIIAHWHVYYADGDSISVLYHIFFYYTYSIKWHYIPTYFIWAINMPGILSLNFIKEQ